MLFGEKILDYWDDILKDLATVVAIPSVAKPQEGEHPLGFGSLFLKLRPKSVR